jgi:hypothetical protein
MRPLTQIMKKSEKSQNHLRDRSSSNCVVFCNVNSRSLTSISFTRLAIIFVSSFLNNNNKKEKDYEIWKREKV